MKIKKIGDLTMLLSLRSTPGAQYSSPKNRFLFPSWFTNLITNVTPVSWYFNHTPLAKVRQSSGLARLIKF